MDDLYRYMEAMLRRGAFVSFKVTASGIAYDIKTHSFWRNDGCHS